MNEKNENFDFILDGTPSGERVTVKLCCYIYLPPPPCVVCVCVCVCVCVSMQMCVCVFVGGHVGVVVVPGVMVVCVVVVAMVAMGGRVRMDWRQACTDIEVMSEF